MTQITPLDTTTDPYVSVAYTAALLGIKPDDVRALLQRNEIESRTLILRTSLQTYLAAGDHGE